MLKIFRQRCINFHIIFGGRMNKTQYLGMKRLTLKFKRHFYITVDSIPQQRMTDTCHMYSYLVGTSGFQNALNISIFSETLKYSVMCHCILSVFFINSHFFPICLAAEVSCLTIQYALVSSQRQSTPG